MKPKISLIIPAYNVEKYISETLQSIKQQTANSDLFETVIVDDGSTDNTPFLIEQEIKNMENVIYIRREENKGTSATRNEAIELSNGKYIALLDGDDLLEPFAINSTLEFINKHPNAKYIYSKYKRIDEFGNPLPNRPGYYFSREDLYHLNFVGHLKCFTREVHNKIGGFEEGNEVEDWDHVIKASEILNGNQIMHNPDLLYIYRVHKNSKTIAQIKEVRKSAIKMLINALKRRKIKVEKISFHKTREGHSYYDWD